MRVLFTLKDLSRWQFNFNKIQCTDHTNTTVKTLFPTNFMKSLYWAQYFVYVTKLISCTLKIWRYERKWTKFSAFIRYSHRNNSFTFRECHNVLSGKRQFFGSTQPRLVLTFSKNNMCNLHHIKFKYLIGLSFRIILIYNQLLDLTRLEHNEDDDEANVRWISLHVQTT